MSLYLLDTDSIIDVLKGFATSVTFIQSLVAQGHTLVTTDIVLAEVYSGLPSLPTPGITQWRISP